MKNIKKTLLIVVAMILMCAMSAAVTLALYSATTNELDNTFTFGNVSIKLDETDPDNPNQRVETGVEYDIDPGITYVKDPKITNTSDDEKAWVRVAVTFDQNVAAEFGTELEGFVVDENGRSTLDLDNWKFAGVYTDADKNTVYVYDYKTALEAGATTTAIFSKFTIPAAWDPSADGSRLTSGQTFISVKGYAIQESGIAEADVAATMADVWSEFDGLYIPV
jgi:hypothetical protein